MTSHEHPHATPFGSDRFGQLAERFARFFGTPRFIIAQTAIVIAWILVNVAMVALRFDKYPFILLNLLFSTQAAYAAPLILLAQTRQADRDKHNTDADRQHREQLAHEHTQLLQANTDLTQQVERLAQEIHTAVTRTTR